MNTSLLLISFVGLQASFIFVRYTAFDGSGGTKPGARAIELSTIFCIGLGLVFIVWVRSGPSILDGLGYAIGLFSLSLLLWALKSVEPRQLTTAFSQDLPAVLLTRGAFAFVRNPFYVSYLLAHTLPLVASRSLWGLLPLVWMTSLYWRATKMEEKKFLKSSLAREWRCYAAVTGRFLPRLKVIRAFEKGVL